MCFLWHEPISVLFPFIAGCSAFHEDEQQHEHCRQLPPRSRPWEPETESQLWRGFETGWSNCSRRCSQNIQRRLAVGALPGSSFLAIIHWSRRSGFLPKEWGVTRYCKLIALCLSVHSTSLYFAVLLPITYQANFELVTLWVRIHRQKEILSNTSAAVK